MHAIKLLKLFFLLFQECVCFIIDALLIVDSGTDHSYLLVAASFCICTVLQTYRERAFILRKGKELLHHLQQPVMLNHIRFS